MKKKICLTDIIIMIMIAIVLIETLRTANSRSLSDAEKMSENPNLIIFKTSVPNYVGKNIKVGDPVIEKTNQHQIGTVKKVELGPDVNFNDDRKGQLTRSSREGYCSVKLTVETPGILKESGLLIDKFTYYVGKTMDFSVGICFLEEARTIDLVPQK